MAIDAASRKQVPLRELSRRSSSTAWARRPGRQPDRSPGRRLRLQPRGLDKESAASVASSTLTRSCVLRSSVLRELRRSPAGRRRLREAVDDGGIRFRTLHPIRLRHGRGDGVGIPQVDVAELSGQRLDGDRYVHSYGLSAINEKLRSVINEIRGRGFPTREVELRLRPLFGVGE